MNLGRVLHESGKSRYRECNVRARANGCIHERSDKLRIRLVRARTCVPPRPRGTGAMRRSGRRKRGRSGGRGVGCEEGGRNRPETTVRGWRGTLHGNTKFVFGSIDESNTHLCTAILRAPRWRLSPCKVYYLSNYRCGHASHAYWAARRGCGAISDAAPLMRRRCCGAVWRRSVGLVAVLLTRTAAALTGSGGGAAWKRRRRCCGVLDGVLPGMARR